MSEKYPNGRSLQRSLMSAYNHRAENYTDFEKYERAIELYQNSLNIAQAGLQSDPKDYQSKRDFGIASKRLAVTLNSCGKSREALERMKVSIRVYEELAEADPHNTENLYDIANTRFSIGEIYLVLKNYQAALDTCQKAESEFRRAIEINLRKNYFKRTLALLYKVTGKIYEELAEKENRRENLQRAVDNYNLALDGLNALKDEGELSKYDLKGITSLESYKEKALAKLSGY